MTPLPFRWDGEAFAPLPRFVKAADREFVVGEVYRLAPIEDRSMLSHRHYFAAIREAWQNLPETEGERFPTPEHLRKHALIRTGYRDEKTFVAASKADALRLAAFVRPMDEYAVVTVSEAVVRVWTAQSQSVRAMGKKAFQTSKDDVLAFLEGMVGVGPGELMQQAGKAA